MAAFRYPVEEIRERCDLVDIISAHVALRKRGKNLIGLCPFHNEKTPSFNVDSERQIWKCFGCGEGGDVFSFVQKIDNVTFPEAVEQLARKVGVTIEVSERAAKEISEKERILKANSVACGFFRGALQKSSAAKSYLAKRRIEQSTIEKYRLGYAPESWDELCDYLTQQRVGPADAVKAGLIVPRESSQGFYDRFRDRVIFPILDTSDRVIAFGGRILGDGEPKYLNSPESLIFAKNKTLYGLNFARRAIAHDDRGIIVEGYMDTIAAQEAGFENTVATMGTALTEEHVNIISRFTKNVVLAFDADSAGMAAALRSSPIFERAGFNIRILNMPRGEDPDSLLRSGDRSRFAALVTSALPISDYRVSLALAKHDLDSDEGRAAALKELVEVLADIDSAVDRERLIRHLAKYHPNFGTGTTLVEDQLRGEVMRLKSRAARRQPYGDESRTQRESAQPPDKKLSLVQRAERLLLGIIIIHGGDASKVFAAVSPKEFIDEHSRLLAEAVSRQYAELGKIEEEDLRSRIAGTPAEDLLTDLLIGLDESELNHSVDELVRVIINHKNNER